MTEFANIAENLNQQCINGECFKPININSQPIDLKQGYSIQNEFIKQLRGRGLGQVAGYKVGLTSKSMQDFCGVNQPISGKILDQRIYPNHHAFSPANFVRLGVESELAFKIKKPVPVLDDEDNVSLLLNAIASVHAAFEIVDDRSADYSCLDAASIVAENAWNAGILTAEGIAGERLEHLDQLSGKLFINDQLAGEGSSGDVLGNPLNVLKWLAKFLNSQGEKILPGQWVLTGSIVPTQFPSPGDKLTFQLQGLSKAELSVKPY